MTTSVAETLPNNIAKIPNTKKEGVILAMFAPEEQKIIKRRQKILSSLAYFIGKDFRIPVKLGMPGEGWCWNFQENIIYADPVDLLNKSMDYLRFVISHEGAHRRISRADFISEKEWKQPGFKAMMNAIEDPRVNNFTIESYPKFHEQMESAHLEISRMMHEINEESDEKLGHKPRFMQATFEYIQRWFAEVSDKRLDSDTDFSVDEVRDTVEGALAPAGVISEEVIKMVDNTIIAAQDSWWTYPSREEADSGEETITDYARASYEINKKRIWSEFKKLVKEDMEDQTMQEALQEMAQQMNGGGGIPQELLDQLASELIEELMKTLQDMVNEGEGEEHASPLSGASSDKVKSEGQGQGESGCRPAKLTSLSDDLKQKIKDYIDSLSEEKRKELSGNAKEALNILEKKIADQLGGKLSETPERKTDGKKTYEEGDIEEEGDKETPASESKDKTYTDKMQKLSSLIRKTLEQNDNHYEEVRREVLPIIDKLESDLREIFVSRKLNMWKSGFKRGKRIKIKKRIQEKAKSISAMESKSWQKRELPKEKDYAITLLVDLSGSMWGENIEQTFRAVVVLAEVLNRLSISTEILGFNNNFYEYQNYGEDMSSEIREKISSMPCDVNGSTSATPSLQLASGRLARQKVQEKFIIMLTDGGPNNPYDFQVAVDEIVNNTDQKLVGLGLGPCTDYVGQFFPNSLANIDIHEMSEKLADLIRDVIENYHTY